MHRGFTGQHFHLLKNGKLGDLIYRLRTKNCVHPLVRHRSVFGWSSERPLGLCMFLMARSQANHAAAAAVQV